jgi:formyltetrahydrofolate hydrolase
LSLNFLNAISLNKENISKKNDLELALNAINNFVPNYKKNIDKINKNDRKFHLKTAFFLYKTRIRLEKNTSFESEILLKENRNLQSNFDEKFLISDNNWRKEFLQRATKYHHDYLHLFGEE